MLRVMRSQPFLNFASLRSLATVTARANQTPEFSLDRGRVPQAIWDKTTAKLHRRPGHPLHTLRTHIEAYFHSEHPGLFTTYSDLPCVVTSTQCFDNLLVPEDHPSRAESDTYYLDESRLLRAHMTAHDVEMLSNGESGFLLTGDVYRRDTVDRTHYPVFHQMDGVRVFPEHVSREEVKEELKRTLEGVAKMLFGDVQMRWVDAYFPFTTPSLELEVMWQGEWLEVLGCGLMQREVLRKGLVSDKREAWAFGMGLERLAMVLFEVPDIRLFWSDDSRVTSQFKEGNIGTKYKPFSVYPGIEKDVAFWVREGFQENDLCEIVRETCGDLVEDVRRVDIFEKDDRTSYCYRILFRSMERSLTHQEVNSMFSKVQEQMSSALPVSLR